jgi:two-component system cell cycle sensor histidine kinase/response regulator CckA
VEDVTKRIRSEQERARAERALRESEERFRALVQNSSDITVTLDPDGTVRYASPALERILGYEPNAILGDNPFDYMHPDDVEVMQAQLTETIAHPGIPVSSEFRLRHADGSWLYVETIGNNLLDQPGIEGVVVNARDITERRRAEEAVRESEAWLKSTIESLPFDFFALDSDGRYKLQNSVCRSSWGDIVGKHPEDIAPSEEIAAKWADNNRRAFCGETITEEVEWVHKGKRAFNHNIVSPVYDGDQIRGIIGVNLDITERVQVEEARARSKQQIEQLNRLQSDLLGPHTLTEKLDAITEGVVSIFDADFARIWIIKPGDLCDGDCIHAEPKEGPHVCRHRDKCLHLVSSSGRYSHIDGEMHRRVPFGCYKIGRVAAGEEPKFITNNVVGDPRVHDHEWARQLGLVSFAGYRLKSTSEEIIGVLALFSKHPLSPDEDALLEGMANTTAQVVQAAYAEEALERSEATLRSIFRVAPVGIGLVSDRVLLWVNDLICEVLGYSSDELIGKSARVLYPSDAEYEYVGQEKYAQISERGTGTVETRWQRRDGKQIDVLLSSTPIDPSDLSKGVTFTALDITERVRSEQEREKAENERQLLLTQIQAQAHQLQQVMDTVPAGVILLDDKDRIVLANPLGTKHLAILADTPVGGTLTRLGSRPLPAILTSPPQGLWHDIAAEGREFQVIARPIETGPTPAGWVLVIRDVTEQRGIERRGQQQERLASLGQLAAGIAHDFNNIMAVITLYASMSLRAPDVHPKIAERLEVIDQQARRASELIEQIMDFSRRAVLERGPMDLLAFAKEQTRLLRRTLPESIRVNLTYGKDDYMIRADPTRIQQVMMNLGTNARDAMPEGGKLHIILDRVQIEKGTPPPMPEMDAGNWICLKMADTGTGIPQDVLPHIFDPFFTTKQPGSGTGLGLAQVYGIVKQHEGHIDVQNSDKEGTTFVIYLPALSVEPPVVSPSRVQELPQGEGHTILVVEDDTTARAAIVSSLELLGYQVVESANGQEALEAYEQHASEIDLVLSDMVMPEMGGRVLFRQLSRQRAGVKVILMSGHPLEEAALEELRAEGLTGWLPKPPGLAKLAEAVSQALAHDGSSHEPSS